MTMKKLAAAAVVLSAGAVPAVASADLSANIGFVTEYVFRGLYQAESSASAGIDYESDAGFYIGAWGADVGQGLETDLYFGYGGSSGDFSWSVGYTGYFYTDDFDGEYNEINLGVGYGIFAIDVAVGEFDPLSNAPTADYTFTSLTLSPGDGPYVTFGTFSQDADGDYFEFGYGRTVMDELDLSAALLYSDEIDTAGTGFVIPGVPSSGLVSEWNLVFGVTKSFGLGAD